jgi:hypothetical protein
MVRRARTIVSRTAINCPLWPFRMGTNPWRAPISEERRAGMAARIVGGLEIAQAMGGK